MCRSLTLLLGRRKKDNHVFLVAVYECNENHELEIQ